jgi:hypothetical protein
MAVQYAMKITGMAVYPEYEGKTNVVSRAYWTLSATDGSASYTYPGQTAIRYNPDGPWLEYDSLSEDEVLGWISRDAASEILAVRASLALNFPDAAASENKPLPW